MPKSAFILLGVIALMITGFHEGAFAQERQVKHAVYLIGGAIEGDTPVAHRVELSVGESRAKSGSLWEMKVFLEDRTLTVRALSERAPMTHPDGPGEFEHYAFLDAEGVGLEYRDKRTGKALLPRFDFVNQFLPTPRWETPYVDGFAASGQFLGHVATLESVTVRPAPEPWPYRTLELRSDLLIGTGRPSRDDGTGTDEYGQYSYVNFTGEDYKEMIDAGINYFGVRWNQLEHVIHEPVFYLIDPVFPDAFYRSNYVGTTMYTDEPMVRLGWEEVVPSHLKHPHQVVSYLMTRVEAMYNNIDNVRGPYRVEQGVRRQGIDLGTMRLIQEDVPCWETVYESAFYELMGGTTGIVHEGRYVMPEGYGWHPSSILGHGLEVTPTEMLKFYYTFLRGAARAWDGDWGTAIYGQSDPEFRLEALTLAYDMGAKYCWFWTSDHDHHVPYVDQLALTRGLMEHIRANPRGDIYKLRDAPREAVAYPMGYSVSWGQMWGIIPFSNENVTPGGASYREVAATGLWEGIERLKKGIDFDYTIDHKNLKNLGYTRIVRVGEDASVIEWPSRFTTEPSRPALRLQAGQPEPVSIPEEATRTLRATCFYGNPPTIDGNLDDWPRENMLVLDVPLAGTEEWTGPEELSATLMFGYDEKNLYFAARVRDDVHSQSHGGWDLWRGDSIQIGFDPLNIREPFFHGYAPNMHEIGFALLDDGREVAWRWHGRKGQPLHEIHSVDLVINRDDEQGLTIYEAAIPLSELTPLIPEIFGLSGFAVVVNDADLRERERHLETDPGVLTAGKHPDRFWSLLFEKEDSSQEPTARSGWAALIWNDTVLRTGESITLDLYTVSVSLQDLNVQADLTPRGSTHAAPARASVRVPADENPKERSIEVTLDAEMGQYDLKITVMDEDGVVLIRDELPVYVY